MGTKTTKKQAKLFTSECEAIQAMITYQQGERCKSDIS